MNTEIQPKKKVRYTINFECLCQKYNPNTSTVFGKIFNLEIHGRYGEFRGSIDFLAKRVGLSYATTLRVVKILLKEQLIIDTTPESKRKQRMQVRHYRTNQTTLLKISEEMDLITDEEIFTKKLDNEIKKKLIQNSAAGREVLDIFDLVVDDTEEEYENPFEELEDEVI